MTQKQVLDKLLQACLRLDSIFLNTEEIKQLEKKYLIKDIKSLAAALYFSEDGRGPSVKNKP
jgi:hypothetical protein